MAGFGALILKQTFPVPLRSGIQFDHHRLLGIAFRLIETLPIVLAQARGDRRADGEFHLGFGHDEAGIQIVRNGVGGLGTAEERGSYQEGGGDKAQ